MIKKGLPTLLILFALSGCDSTRSLYTSSDNKGDYWTINAYTMSHCGCTQLFAEKVKNRKNEFQIMYTDNVARKNIYTYNDKGIISDTTSLVATVDRVEIPFDSLDHVIFKRIETIIDKKDGLVYEMKWTEYKGYRRKD